MKQQQFFIYKGLNSLFFYKLIMIFLLITITLVAKSQEPALVALGNQSGVPSSMHLSELKSVLMGERQRWKNGDKIIIALMKTNTPTGKSTSSKIYDMTGD